MEESRKRPPSSNPSVTNDKNTKNKDNEDENTHNKNTKNSKNNNNNNNKNANTGGSVDGNKKNQRKSKREFDMSKYSKRHIALKVAYVGWDFHGFASQADTDNTIEGHVFAALHKTCLITSREESHYTRCGRTDKGVSAFGQVIALHLRSNLTSGLGIIDGPTETDEGVVHNAPTNNTDNSTNNNNTDSTSTDTQNNKGKAVQTKAKVELDYAAVLNRVLPHEIRVIGWAPVPSHFNARFSALYRTYKYFFVPEGYDLEAMKQAAKAFVGEHDFRNFCKMDVENVKSFTRVILSISVESGVITLSGFAFLWHQVRCMVAVLFMVGRHLELPDIISTLLNTSLVPAKPIYDMASEIPLVLFDCGYEDLQWTRSEGSEGEGAADDVSRKLIAHFEAYFNELYLKSKVVKLMLDSIKAAFVAPKLPPLNHVPLLKRGTEDSLDMRLKKQQSKQSSSKKPKWDDE